MSRLRSTGPAAALGSSACRMVVTVWLAAVGCAEGAEPGGGESALSGVGAGQPIVEAVNAHRAHEGRVPLRPHPALQRVAEEVMAVIEERGTTRNVDLGIHAFVSRVRRHGYVEGTLVIGTVAGGSPTEVAEGWPEADPTLWGRLIQPELRDVGVAVGWKGRDPYVLVLAGVTRAQNLAEAADDLELESVRRQILEWTNELRQRRGLWELRRSDALDAVAQSYAEDMIVRGFYGHESPEGTTVKERVSRAGYRAVHVGENLASGTADPREVFDGWVASATHRDNLLFPSYHHLGVGMARGWTEDGDYRIVWVQIFGRGR